MGGWRSGRLRLLAAALLPAACLLTFSASAGAPPVAASGPMSATALARQLVQSAPVAQQATQVSQSPDDYLDRPWATETQEWHGTVVRALWWTVDEPADTAFQQIRGQTPAGTQRTVHGSAQINGQTIDYVKYKLLQKPSTVNHGRLEVDVISTSASQSDVGAFAVVVRQPVRSPLQTVPVSKLRRVRLDTTSGYSDEPSEHTFKGARAAALARAFNQSRADPIVHHLSGCPKQQPEPPWTATFVTAHHKWIGVGLSGCRQGDVRIRRDGQRVPPTLVATRRYDRLVEKDSEPAHTVPVFTRHMLTHLPVRAAHYRGYERSKFRLWTSHPDGCNTRYKVLIRDAVRKPHVGAGCYLTDGEWVSPYDGYATTNPTNIQIDHVVALGAAWGAGAWKWDSNTRERFANDLGTHYDLIAVSAHANESKGDAGPDQYLPPRRRFDCRYMTDYTAVLWRWHLNIDRPELRFLRSHLQACGWPTIHEPKRPAIHDHGTKHHHKAHRHSCTRTSSGSCIAAGEFCPQADYGQYGYDAHGDRLQCTGGRKHPHWARP